MYFSKLWSAVLVKKYKKTFIKFYPWQPLWVLKKNIKMKKGPERNFKCPHLTFYVHCTYIAQNILI